MKDSRKQAVGNTDVVDALVHIEHFFLPPFSFPVTSIFPHRTAMDGTCSTRLGGGLLMYHRPPKTWYAVR